MDKENVLGEKIKLCIAIFLMSLLCLNGCSSNSVEYSSETIDTVGVVIFTDKLIEDKEYDILQRSVSQRTDTNDKFIVEYWWRKNNDSGHYGYYIEQIDGDNYIVIEEGEDINSNILNKKTAGISQQFFYLKGTFHDFIYSIKLSIWKLFWEIYICPCFR